MKRRTGPDFDVEPWASTLIDYCYFGGVTPPPSVSTDPLEPSRTYAPPAAPPKPRKLPKAKAASSSPPPPAAKARPTRPRRQQPPPPPEPTIDELIEECLRQSRALEAQYAQYARHARQAPAAFQVLGAPYPCTTEQLRARWREVAFQHHPDHGGDVTNFIRLKNAYEEAKRIQESGTFVVFKYPG